MIFLHIVAGVNKDIRISCIKNRNTHNKIQTVRRNPLVVPGERVRDGVSRRGHAGRRTVGARPRAGDLPHAERRSVGQQLRRRELPPDSPVQLRGRDPELCPVAVPIGHVRVAVADGRERPGHLQAAAVHQPALPMDNARGLRLRHVPDRGLPVSGNQPQPRPGGPMRAASLEGTRLGPGPLPIFDGPVLQHLAVGARVS